MPAAATSSAATAGRRGSARCGRLPRDPDDEQDEAERDERPVAAQARLRIDREHRDHDHGQRHEADQRSATGGPPGRPGCGSAEAAQIHAPNGRRPRARASSPRGWIRATRLHPGWTRKFDPRADDGIAPGADPFGMITNDLEVTVAAARRRRRGAGPRDPRAGPAQVLRRRRQALDGVDLDVRRGEVLARARPQRRGQDDARRDPRGPPRRRRRRGVASSGTTPPRASARSAPASASSCRRTASTPAHRARGGRALQRRLPAPARRRPRSLDLVGLGDRPDVRVSALSGGQRRRLDLALGIAGDPELVFLDEPTTGFDPSARRQSWELIAALRDLGKTILLDDPLHGRGPAPRRPRRRHRARQRHRRGHARHARARRRRGGARRLPHPVRRGGRRAAVARGAEVERRERHVSLPHAHPDPRPRCRC